MKSSRSVHPRVSEYAQRDAADLLRDFRLSGDGLSASEAQENRAKYGENRLSGPAPDTVPRRLRRAFVNPFTAVLLVLTVISFVTDVLLPSNFSRSLTTPALMLSMLLVSGVVRLAGECRPKQIANVARKRTYEEKQHCETVIHNIFENPQKRSFRVLWFLLFPSSGSWRHSNPSLKPALPSAPDRFPGKPDKL